MNAHCTYKRCHCFVLLFFSIFYNLPAGTTQISPGKLSQPHSHLEGLSNCTQCHTLGDKIAEEKCLLCHEALSNRISSKKGFHVSSEVKNKSCISCHSEHHGVKFQMIRFDEKTFNHQLTGYPLSGKHKTQDCRACHTADKIQNSELKKDPNTYLGLDPKCISCHEDRHQKTLSSDCASCHDFNAWKPASAFNHQKTNFPLQGQHQKVDCKACHANEIKNGKNFQKFAGIESKTCASCHKDPHTSHFGQNCKGCHTEESFSKIKSTPIFNHQLTGFVLEGKHKSIDCKKCHDHRQGTAGIFKEFKNQDKHDCIQCHADVHENKFGNDCSTCHTNLAFRPAKISAQFNHNVTSFPLLGKHQKVDCKKCHISGKMTDPLAFDQCNSCHADFHKGEFKKSKYPDCSNCHTVESFQESTFSFEHHDSTLFPLKGAHLAVSCVLCHKKETRWTFQNMGKNCHDCHQDFHKDRLDRKFYEPNACANCHREEAWSSISFDHNQTAFPLEGKHQQTTCRACHFKPSTINPVVQIFKGLDNQCSVCHQDPHYNQFESNGRTTCDKCHHPVQWQNIRFDHNLARFKLEGEHKALSCQKCHFEEQFDGKTYTIYRNNKLECRNCHL